MRRSPRTTLVSWNNPIQYTAAQFEYSNKPRCFGNKIKEEKQNEQPSGSPGYHPYRSSRLKQRPAMRSRMYVYASALPPSVSSSTAPCAFIA